MPRLPCRLGIALLWIAIALLPMRGLAAALMPALMAPAAAEAMAGMDEAPCHGADEAEADRVALGDCPSCSLCALCHGSVAQAPAPSLALPALPAVTPAAGAPSPIEPRAPDGLFRPPRSLLA